MHNGISKLQEWNALEFYFKIPEEMKKGKLSISAETKTIQDIYIKDLIVKSLVR